MKRSILSIAPFLYLIPSLSFAHSDSGSGFSSGFSHPVLGLDHLLAMVSVGIISAQMGGKAIWTVPATFVLVMAFGGMLGMMDVGLISIELGIALSVIFLGLIIARGKRIATIAVLGMISFFAIFHGYAHGLEMPSLAISWHYAAGFMLGTALLHMIGVAIGLASRKFADGSTALRYGGAVIAGMGLHILLGMYGF